jgi:endonuclease-3
MAAPKKSHVNAVLEALANTYPTAECALVHTNAFELTVATILSAQCTDKRVNLVTPTLFARYPTPEALADAPVQDVEELVKSTNFYRNKAKNLVAMASMVVHDFDGQVPRTMAELIRLPGVARKTANVVLSVGHGLCEGIVVDTHVKRVGHRLGLSPDADPVKVEQALMAVVPRARWMALSHELIEHGRGVCLARRPDCMNCKIVELCPKIGVIHQAKV